MAIRWVNNMNSIPFRQLTDEETQIAVSLFEQGHRSIRKFITALLYHYRGLEYSDDFIPYINRHIGLTTIMFWDSNSEADEFFWDFTESFLCETTAFKDCGRLYQIKKYYGQLNEVSNAVFAFTYGIELLTGIHEPDLVKSWDVKQVTKLYKNDYLPLINEQSSELDKCIIAYRFFVSVLEYFDFKYLGKSEISSDFIDDFLVEGVKAMINDEDYDAFQTALSNYYSKYSKTKF